MAQGRSQCGRTALARASESVADVNTAGMPRGVQRLP